MAGRAFLAAEIVSIKAFIQDYSWYVLRTERKLSLELMRRQGMTGVQVGEVSRG